MIRVFISSVQAEFAEERRLLCNYIRQDALLGNSERLYIGTTDILEKCRMKGLRNPVFDFDGDFNVTIWRREEETASDSGNAGVKLNKMQKHIVELTRNQPDITYEEMATALGVSPTTIFRNIAFLKEHNIIRRIGEDKNGHWEVEQ